MSGTRAESCLRRAWPVYVARFRNVKGRWVIVEGDPIDRHWTNGVGAQKILRGNRLHEMLRSFSGEEIVELKLRELELFDCLGQPLRAPSFVVRA